MTNAEMAKELRRLAGEIEKLEVELDLHCQITSYNVTTIEELRSCRTLIQHPTASSNGGTHWLTGDFCEQVEVTAYYTPGLLGKATRKRTVEVVTEDTPDLSILQ